MTVPGPDTQRSIADDNQEEKRQRGLEPDELPAVYVALGVGLIAIVLAVVTYSLDSAAVWLVGIAAGLIVLGLWGGIRGAVGAGVLMLAIGGMVLTHDWSLGPALLMNGVVVTCALAIMVGADLSFVMRRGSQVASQTVQGLTTVHAVALGVGILASAVVVGTVEAIDWPSWLLIVPVAVLAVVAVWMAHQVRSYRRHVRAVDAPVIGQGPAVQAPNSMLDDLGLSTLQPALAYERAAISKPFRRREDRTNVQAVDAPVIGQGPAAPPPDSKWRQFRWKSGDDA